MVGGEDDTYWYGFEMTAEHDVDMDAPLQSADFTGDYGALATGYYVFDQSVYWILP